jgi:hypothetical protein
LAEAKEGKAKEAKARTMTSHKIVRRIAARTSFSQAIERRSP